MLYLIVGVGLLAADQWVKYWVVTHLEPGGFTPLIPGFVELFRVHNYGAAWRQNGWSRNQTSRPVCPPPWCSPLPHRSGGT